MTMLALSVRIGRRPSAELDRAPRHAEPEAVGDIGLALLGLAAVRAGAPRWAGAAIAIRAFAEGAGFATGTKALGIVAFAVLFLGLLQAVRTRSGAPAPRLAAPGRKPASVACAHPGAWPDP